MDTGTVLLAASDQPGLKWFQGQLDEAGGPMSPGLVQASGQAVEAACFETSFDALQAVERILATAPVAGMEVSLALVAFGWGDPVDPAGATGALALARGLLATAPRGAATTCGSAAMVAGPLLGAGFELVWTEDVVQGPEGCERVFRIVGHAGGTGVPSHCLEWARRYAAGPLNAEGLPALASDGGLPRLSIARAPAGGTVESEIARLALQAHARGDVVLRVDHRRGRREGNGRHAGKILLQDLMTRHLSRQRASGPVLPAERRGTVELPTPLDLRSAPGFACLDDLEAWLRTMAGRTPTTLVVPDPCALDEISQVVIERLLQDHSLSGFSVITSQAGDMVPDAVRQMASTLRRADAGQRLVS